MEGRTVEELRYQIASNAPGLKSSSQECISNDLLPLRAFKTHRNSKCAISQPEAQPHHVWLSFLGWQSTGEVWRNELQKGLEADKYCLTQHCAYRYWVYSEESQLKPSLKPSPSLPPSLSPSLSLSLSLSLWGAFMETGNSSCWMNCFSIFLIPKAITKILCPEERMLNAA